MLSTEKFERHKTEVEGRTERRGRLALRNYVKAEKRSRHTRGIEGRMRNENVFARPNGLCENAETAISCRGAGPARKKKRGIPVAERRRK